MKTRAEWHLSVHCLSTCGRLRSAMLLSAMLLCPVQAGLQALQIDADPSVLTRGELPACRHCLGARLEAE